MKTKLFFYLVLFVVLLLMPGLISAQTTEFTYQRRMTDGSLPPTANYDFEFRLFDIATGGTTLGTLQLLDVSVSSGVFTVQLDFGAQFTGENRFLEIAVRQAGGPTFTTLTPRQPITSAPHGIRSLNAANAEHLDGIDASGFIQNTTTPAQSADFNISGSGRIGGNLTVNGTATFDTLNALTQYNIGGNRVLSVAGTNNTFAGLGAGIVNTGFNNSFFGRSAGFSNTVGNNNTFFGSLAGLLNTTGNDNALFGTSAGERNTTGNNNSFFGTQAGQSNTTGINNSFFGRSAGASNTTGVDNTFIGMQAGQSNTTGNNNSFFGRSAGIVNTTGSDNSFFGTSAGDFNTTGSSNSFFGRQAGASNTTGNENSFFGTGAGTRNTDGDFNSFFGRAAGELNTTGINNSFFGHSSGQANTTGSANAFFGFRSGRANTTGGANTFFGASSGSSNTTGLNNSFFGTRAGSVNTEGSSNSFFGVSAGFINTSGNRNTFVGMQAGDANMTGSDNSALGNAADVGSSLSFATAIGAGSTVQTSNSVVLGRNLDTVQVPGDFRVSQDAQVSGRLIIGTFGANGSTPLCRNASLRVSGCSTPLAGGNKELIETLRRQKAAIERMQQQIDALKRLVCSSNKEAEVCGEEN